MYFMARQVKNTIRFSFLLYRKQLKDQRQPGSPKGSEARSGLQLQMSHSAMTISSSTAAHRGPRRPRYCSPATADRFASTCCITQLREGSLLNSWLWNGGQTLEFTSTRNKMPIDLLILLITFYLLGLTHKIKINNFIFILIL